MGTGRARRIFEIVVVVLGVGLGACRRATPGAGELPSILLFDGRGTSRDDVTAIERLLERERLSYAKADSEQVDEMSELELASYRLLIVPGGNFEKLGNGLAPSTPPRVRAAVEHGLGYLGVCAGAFWAGGSPYNGLNLTRGVRFPFYSLENQGTRKASVPISIAGADALEQYWEDGPALAGFGDVIAKYPDGTPAVVEAHVGQGWVILSGTHPEAPDSWREGLPFTTSGASDQAYAVRLIRAALNREVLPHY